MRIIKTKDYNDMSRKAADIMASVITLNPTCTLGLATGSTPIGLYKNLIASYESGNLDFSKVHSINLDEYKGLSGDNDQSYRYFCSTMSTSTKQTPTFPTDWSRILTRPAKLTMRSSTLLAALTSSCLVLDAMVTSVSMSPAITSRRKRTV